VGKGYATEAGRALIAWAFRQDTEELFAVARPNNVRATATAKRLGMQWVGATTKYYRTQSSGLPDPPQRPLKLITTPGVCGERHRNSAHRDDVRSADLRVRRFGSTAVDVLTAPERVAPPCAHSSVTSTRGRPGVYVPGWAAAGLPQRRNSPARCFRGQRPRKGDAASHPQFELP
jgi:hypothetical protein